MFYSNEIDSNLFIGNCQKCYPKLVSMLTENTAAACNKTTKIFGPPLQSRPQPLVRPDLINQSINHLFYHKGHIL